jgi:hypothetical protein
MVMNPPFISVIAVIRCSIPSLFSGSSVSSVAIASFQLNQRVVNRKDSKNAKTG